MKRPQIFEWSTEAIRNHREYSELGLLLKSNKRAYYFSWILLSSTTKTVLLLQTKSSKTCTTSTTNKQHKKRPPFSPHTCAQSFQQGGKGNCGKFHDGILESWKRNHETSSTVNIKESRSSLNKFQEFEISKSPRPFSLETGVRLSKQLIDCRLHNILLYRSFEFSYRLKSVLQNSTLLFKPFGVLSPCRIKIQKSSSIIFYMSSDFKIKRNEKDKSNAHKVRERERASCS